MEEQIILVNELGESIGVAPKLESHHDQTPLHLAFSCYVFNKEGQFLLTKRAAVKKVWPGVLTNSFCGHPAPGESFEDAIKRRGAYELGIVGLTNITKLIDYRYKTPPFNDIIENEICPVFTATYEGEITLNLQEVETYRWVDWSWLITDTKEEPNKYSYWLKDQISHMPNVNDLPLTAVNHQ